MPNAHNKSTSNNDDKPKTSRPGAGKKNEDKSSARGSQSSNRGSGSGGKGKSSGSNRSSN